MTYTSAKVVNLAQKVVAIKIDVGTPAGAKVAEKLKIEATPTITFLNSKEKLLNQVMGFRDPDTFVKDMNTALAKAAK